eukprot:8629120-Alexandrium_andersonii.AAC.1
MEGIQKVSLTLARVLLPATAPPPLGPRASVGVLGRRSLPITGAGLVSMARPALASGVPILGSATAHPHHGPNRLVIHAGLGWGTPVVGAEKQVCLPVLKSK